MLITQKKKLHSSFKYSHDIVTFTHKSHKTLNQNLKLFFFIKENIPIQRSKNRKIYVKKFLHQVQKTHYTLFSCHSQNIVFKVLCKTNIENFIFAYWKKNLFFHFEERSKSKKVEYFFAKKSLSSLSDFQIYSINMGFAFSGYYWMCLCNQFYFCRLSSISFSCYFGDWKFIETIVE